MDILTICSIVVAILVLPGVLILFLRPSFTLKLIVWFLRHTFLRLRIEGVENIPDSGPVLLVSNHVSLIDMLLIQSISRRPVRFMVRQEILDFVPTRFLFWYLGVIRVPSISHPKAMHRFFLRVRGELRRGGVLCLFPEGSISGNGGLMRFRSGVGPLPIDQQVHGRLGGRVARPGEYPALQIAHHQHVRLQAAFAHPGGGDEDAVLPQVEGQVAVVAHHIAPLVEELCPTAQLLPQYKFCMVHILYTKISLGARRPAYWSSSSCWWYR